MKSFLWPRFSLKALPNFFLFCWLRLLATIVMLLHQWILLFFFSKTNCRTSYPQGRRRTNMPSTTTINQISEFFFFSPVHHPISTRHFDSCQLVPGGFYPPNPLRKLWCWEKIWWTTRTKRHFAIILKITFIWIFAPKINRWTKPPGGGTVCRRGWSGVAAELAELALVNQVDQLTHQVDDVTNTDQLLVIFLLNELLCELW